MSVSLRTFFGRATTGPNDSQSTHLRALVQALDRSYAVIEFTPDGTVLSANPLFLKLMGYTLEEITGQHHRMFVEPAVRNSEEYRQFWDRLARGESISEKFLRIGKADREVWIQAVYNAVLGPDGRPTRIVKIATDVTAAEARDADTRGQIAAIGRSHAVVEFSLDGRVLTANENFLRVMGYTLEEIRDRPHSLFVDPAERESAQYRSFWLGLSRGQYDAGVYRRIAKGGREVWIQASYSPILDARNRPIKIVKYATDVTQQRNKDRVNATLRSALESVSANVMVADMDLNITYMNRTAKQLMERNEAAFRKDLPGFSAARLVGTNIDGFHKNPAHQRHLLAALSKTYAAKMVIGGRTMTVTANPTVDEQGQRIGTVVEWGDLTDQIATEREMQEVLAAVSAGRLDSHLSKEGKTGFFATLTEGINTLVDVFGGVIGQVKAAAVEVSRGADEISQGNTNLSQRTEEQASSLEQTASSMEQMTSTVKQNADNAAQANQLALAAREQAEKGGGVVAQAVRAMNEINHASAKIADIIGVIDEIAFQTNLLALNAAVEAARAGEQGRGFAVVATEVRNLAGRSATAAKEIKGLIQDSVKKVAEGSNLVTQSGDTLEQLVAAVKKVTDIVAEIAAASQEQSSGIEQVNKAVMQLDELTQQNAALVEQASAASQSMADQARSLSDTISKYTVDQTAAPSARPDLGRGTVKAVKPVSAGSRGSAAAAWKRF